MHRIIRCFDKKTEELIQEIPLPDIPLCQLQSAFSLGADEPMYDCYPVNKKLIALLSEFTSINFELDEFDYFLECEE